MISRKKNAKDGNGRHGMVVAICGGLLVLTALGVGAALGVNVLTDIWQEQCRVEDQELDVVVTTGKMVRPDVVTLSFGLTNGANLATIPFAELRTRLLDSVPNIRDIRIERRLPNRVTIDVIEREPIARVAPRRGQGDGGRVVDLEGVVFRFMNNTSMLPIVREADMPPTLPGKKLTGHAAAALRLVDVASQPEFADLRILEIDTAHSDYLFLTLSNYDRVKLAWDHMLDDSRQARDSLRKQLKRVANAINANITARTTVWIATDWGTPGRVYATDPARNGNQ